MAWPFSKKYNTDENYTDSEGNFNYQKWQEDINSPDRNISDRAMNFGQGLIVDSKGWNVTESQLTDINNAMNSESYRRAQEIKAEEEKAKHNNTGNNGEEINLAEKQKEYEKEAGKIIIEGRQASDNIYSRSNDKAVEHAGTAAKHASDIFDKVDETAGGKVGPTLMKERIEGILGPEPKEDEEYKEWKTKRNILMADHILKSVASFANGIANSADRGNRNTEIDSMLSKYGKANFEQLLKNKGAKEDARNTGQISAVSNINELEQDLNTKAHELNTKEYNNMYERLDSKNKYWLDILMASDVQSSLVEKVTANLINANKEGKPVDVLNEVFNVVISDFISKGFTPDAIWDNFKGWILGLN